MSITDELREWASVEVPYKYGHQLLAIADRIDAEHESACAEAYGSGVMSVPIALDESQWIRLPVDADGEPIHIGDVMAYADNTRPMEVTALVPPAVFLTEDGPRYADMCRHYHAPTVEDVLEEFVARWLETHHDDLPSLKAEYAAKLQLKEDA